MEFLRSFLRRDLAGKPVVASPNVGCFLRLPQTQKLELHTKQIVPLLVKVQLKRIHLNDPVTRFHPENQQLEESEICLIVFLCRLIHCNHQVLVFIDSHPSKSH